MFPRRLFRKRFPVLIKKKNANVAVSCRRTVKTSIRVERANCLSNLRPTLDECPLFFYSSFSNPFASNWQRPHSVASQLVNFTIDWHRNVDLDAFTPVDYATADTMTSRVFSLRDVRFQCILFRGFGLDPPTTPSTFPLCQSRRFSSNHVRQTERTDDRRIGTCCLRIACVVSKKKKILNVLRKT